MKKTILKWVAGIILAPIFLFIILLALVYVPPVQRWLVTEATAIASHETGMGITVESVSLSFPLDISVNGINVSRQSALSADSSASSAVDTIAAVESVIVDLSFKDILDGRIGVDELEFRGVQINTLDLVAAAQVEGTLQRFLMRSRGIDLTNQTVQLNGTSMSGADITVRLLNDTTAADTTVSAPMPWRIVIDSIAMDDINMTLHMAEDTTSNVSYAAAATAFAEVSPSVSVRIGDAMLRGGDIDLGREMYVVDAFVLNGGTVSYGDIAFNDIHIGADSVYCDTLAARMNLRAMTPESDMAAQLLADLNVMDDDNPGQMYVRLYASIGKQDVMRFCEGMPQSFRLGYPLSPMVLRGVVNGNMKRADISGLSVELPTAFRLSASGTARNIADTDRMKADIAINGNTDNLDFLAAFIDAEGTGSFRIPRGISMEGDATVDGSRYALNLMARQEDGVITATAHYDGSTEAYDAELAVSSLNIHNFMPKDSIYTFSAHVEAEGRGFDVFDRKTTMTADARITELIYGSWNVNKVDARLRLADRKAHARVESRNELANGVVSLDALMARDRVDATFVTDLGKADFHTLRFTEKPLTMGMCAHIDMKSDLKETHSLEGYINDLTFINDNGAHRPEDITMDMFTTPDTIHAVLNSGNLSLALNTSGGYMKMIEHADSMLTELDRQHEQRIIDQMALQRHYPTVALDFKCGDRNPLVNMLRFGGIDFDRLDLSMATSPSDGIEGDFRLYSLDMDSLLIDTVRVDIDQDSLNYIRMNAEVVNRPNNPQFVFRALANGYVFGNKLGAGMRIFDANNELGLNLGAHAEMRDSSILVRFAPEKPVIGYKAFTLNKDNFISLGQNMKVRAGVSLIADDGTGVRIYSTGDDDPSMLQDITVSLNKFDLGQITAAIPYSPRVTGLLGGDFRLMADHNSNLSMLSYLSVDDMTYEKYPMGDITSELAYLQSDDSTHVVNATLSSNGREVGVLDGSYLTTGKGWLDGVFTMTRFPLSMANAFIPDGMVELAGYGEGNLSVKGELNRLMVDGEIHLDSTHVKSRQYGFDLRADNKPVYIEDSKLTLKDYSIYGQNDKPLTFNGSVDFSNLDRMAVNMRMVTNDFLLINAKKQRGSVVFGRCYVNLFAGVTGDMQDMRMRGRLDVLGKTNLTYILKNSPLSTDDQLKELVTFTDFRDTTAVKTVVKPRMGGMDMSLTVNVVSGAQVMCALNTAQTNYISIEGGGNMLMTYNPIGGMMLTGRYTVNSGEMKYALPVIPLKTFKLRSGSYIEFTGEVMNPTLNLIATEEIKAQVAGDDGTSRSVLFNCGVKITQTLSKLGLEFTLESPHDMTIRNELESMAPEERGKMAVTMLTTGMYLNSKNSAKFDVNTALNSFLQSEINNIAGSALKDVDISLGMDTNTDAAGQTRNDYSFKFAKRFWNNRFNLIVGGKISDGKNASARDENDSFIDNVSLEYRLDQSAERNVRLFYDRNARDLFEEDVTEYGAGFVWRKKISNLSELFKLETFTGNMMRRQPAMQRTAPADSLRPAVPTDSLRTRIPSDSIPQKPITK